ncbi:hypothetical protein HJC23_010326 [Cyclotella cryptica]|uniref:PPIase cyclophilin-type domain-containing protein n=1 Tax=Cyclotella cryptica TaxID=29204 RepID=A0ABD3QPD9_9STRA|eukprot:CCRYP_003735-RA/>CCRYP_003735-RA protein AED:0.22 eAED:0.22 QI:0/-1/0/1/-1/1/1/0/420
MHPGIDSTSESTPSLKNESVSTCDDIEEGGYSSQEEDTNEAQDQLIMPKFIMYDGYVKRISHVENVTLRRHPNRDENRMIPMPSIAVDNGQYQPTKRAIAEEPVQSIMSRSNLFSMISLLLIVSVAFFAQQVRVQVLHHKLDSLHQTRKLLEESHRILSDELQITSLGLAKYKDNHEKMKKVNHDMSEHMRRLKEEGGRDNSSELEERAQNAENRLKNIVDSIRSASKEQVLRKYGPGPHRVELIVQLPGSQTVQSIILDMASIDTIYGMPHAVHTFLDQVHVKAWDGASFGFHFGHVLLAVPSRSLDGSLAVKQVPTILFPEYNNAYPHEKYTVAFPGRPGTGRDFYINLQSNVMNHSPRIQNGSFVEGEPCFARIVDENSRRVVDAMDRMAVNNNSSLKERVLIQKARIVDFDESSLQ